MVSRYSGWQALSHLEELLELRLLFVDVVKGGNRGVCERREAGRWMPVGLMGAAATAHHWGHHLLTVQHHCSPPAHTLRARIKLMSFSAFIAGTSFFPQASQVRTESTAAEEISFAMGLPSVFLHPFTTLALVLKAQSSAFIQRVHSHPSPHRWMVGAGYLSCPHTFVLPLPPPHKHLPLPQSCSCSNFSPETPLA